MLKITHADLTVVSTSIYDIKTDAVRFNIIHDVLRFLGLRQYVKIQQKSDMRQNSPAGTVGLSNSSNDKTQLNFSQIYITFIFVDAVGCI